jgi:hypothetical protein
MPVGVDLEQVERRIGVSLAVWGTASLVVGGLIRMCARSDRAQAFGRQSAAWGAIDIAIAAVAHLRAGRRTAQPGDADRARLHRVLVVNVVLDAGYVAAGAVLMARADSVAATWPGRPYSAESLRGDGAAVIVQGVFLGVHDAVFAAQTAERAVGGSAVAKAP